MIFVFFFILGAIWGSFSNVCIFRLPQDKGVVLDRSFCPQCKCSIKWYDNIPLISFLYLKRKCRNCDYKIDFQYFFVELLSALIFCIVYFVYGLSVTTLLFIILSIFFIIIFFIDLKHFIIPDELSFPLMFIGLLKSFYPNLDQELFPNLINSLIGGILGYVIIWVIIFLYKKIKNKEGMGLGDAKLLSAIGFWFGWVSVPLIIFFSSVIALLYVAPTLINKTKSLTTEIPFGPYLIIGTLVYIIFGNQIKLILFNI